MMPVPLGSEALMDVEGSGRAKARRPSLPPPPMVGSAPRLVGSDETEEAAKTKEASDASGASGASGASEISGTMLVPELGPEDAAKVAKPPRVGKPPRMARLPRPAKPKPKVERRARLPPKARGTTTAPTPSPEGEPLKDSTLSRVRLSEPVHGDDDVVEGDSTGVQVLEQVRLEPGELVVGTRYRIVGWLGEGGMGVVYECEHVDIERCVALKVLRTAADPSSRRARMFREEARAVSRAGRSEDGQVSNIVEVYDFGELPDGRLWFAMELLHGRSMARMLAEGPMDVARLIGVLRQLCKGMAAVHDANVIHRDIKPGNIMLVRDRGRDDVVKVVDFGVAAVLAEGDSAEVQLEGTPNYMAPEQAMGSEFDHRLDIYAVGAVAFHMLTGTPPFHGDDVFQLLRRVCTEAPPRPSDVNPDIEIPEALEDVLLRCLQKDPNDRYDDMRELEAALCEAQITAKIVTSWDDLPLPQVEPLARYEALVRGMPKPVISMAKPGRVRALVATAVVALSLAGVGVVVARSGDDSSQVDDRISDHVAAARAAAARAVYLYPPPDEPEARTAYVEVVELETLVKELGDDATTAGAELREEFADTLVRLGDRYWDSPGGRPFAVDYYIAALVFDPTLEGIRERAPITAGTLTELQRKAAILDFEAGELSASEPLLALAEDDEHERVRKLEEIGNKEDEHGVQHGVRIQKLIDEEGAAAGVEPSRPKRVARKTEPREGPGEESALSPSAEPEDEGADVAAVREVKRSAELVKQGLSALRSGKRKRAETLFHRALDQDHRSHRALDGLSQVSFARGDYQQAVSYGKRAVAISGKRGNYRIHLGDAYFKVFRYQEAKEQYRRAKELGHAGARARLDKVKSKLGQ